MTLISACAVLLAGGVPAAAAATKPVHHADGKLRDWRGAPTWLAGRTQISRGELIHTDYLYDDYGPDEDGHSEYPPFRGTLIPRTGDHDYPADEGRYGYNAADLRELRLVLDRRGLHILVAFQTMKVRDAAIATIAIDPDGDTGSGDGVWPDGAALRAPGAERFIMLWGRGGRITGPAGDARAVRQRVNLGANAIEAFVPKGALGSLGPRARVWAATGLATEDGRYRPQEGGGTPVFDLAFQGAERYGLSPTNSIWGEERQSQALAAGAVSEFSEALRPGVLRRGKTRRFHPTPGFYNRIFRSRFSYGEGINLKQDSIGGNATPMFRGRYQPYSLYIPEGYRRGQKTPLLIDGHSLDVNHNEYIAIPERHLPQLGDDRGSLVITPLARGTDTWYLDAGLVDVFEAWRDARRHYNADPGRTSITGYSMGGYMTYRLGLLMPDAFARASVYVGPPAYGTWPYPEEPINEGTEWDVRGFTNLIVENGLNLPYEINHGNFDELVPISGVIRQTQTFDQLGNPYRFYHHHADDHNTFIEVADQWIRTREWLGNYRRDLRPVRVRYRRYPSMDLRHAGLVFDGAYWVDKMALRSTGSESAFGRVDATTFALGGNQPKLIDEGTTVVFPGEGGVSPATVTGQHYEPGEPITKRNAFEAKVENLRSILFRTQRMGLDPSKPVTATLTGDGVTKIRFSGRWPPLAARLDGRRVRSKSGLKSAFVRVDLSGGDAHRLVLRPKPLPGESIR